MSENQFLRIQENHQGKIAELEGVEKRLETLWDIGNKKDALAPDSAHLLQVIKSDLAEGQARWAEAIGCSTRTLIAPSSIDTILQSYRKRQ